MNICNAQTLSDRFQEFILPDIFRYGFSLRKMKIDRTTGKGPVYFPVSIHR